MKKKKKLRITVTILFFNLLYLFNYRNFNIIYSFDYIYI